MSYSPWDRKELYMTERSNTQLSTTNNVSQVSLVTYYSQVISTTQAGL